jgi:hypothetical protein
LLRALRACLVRVRGKGPGHAALVVYSSETRVERL